MTPDHFYNELIFEFPSLKEIIDEHEPEYICFKMEEFAVYTKDQIRKNDLSELKKCFQFHEERIEFS